MRIIRVKEVMAMTGLGRSSIYKLQGVGRFPHSIPLSDRAVGWYTYEVEAWMRGKLDARDALRDQRVATSLQLPQYQRWS